MTVEARPFRARDPAGGYTTFVRKDGTTARMPAMVNISRFDGKSGPRIGPRRLFTPIERASYQPYLQAPWDAAAAEAYGGFGERMQRELDNRLVRRAQGRRY